MSHGGGRNYYAILYKFVVNYCSVIPEKGHEYPKGGSPNSS